MPSEDSQVRNERIVHSRTQTKEGVKSYRAYDGFPKLTQEFES